MSTLTSLIRRAPKRLTAAAAMIAAAIIIPAAAFAWGPDRPTYTLDKPADHITFNSMTDNPNVGDERDFVVVKDAANTNDGGWQNTVNVQPGKEYIVRIYVHNNAATSLNLTATNTRVSASVPTTTGKSVPLSGFVTADNATPQKIWDDIEFKSDKNFNLAYVAGSATIYNNGYAKTGKTLPDSIVTNTGAKIGYTSADGNVPGCFQYANYVYIKVKPQFAPTNEFTMSKTVSKHGENKWTENYAAKPGEVVDFLVQYKNVGEAQQNDVTFRDTLPAGLSYVTGSTMLINSKNPSGSVTSDNIANGTGINVGSYTTNANALVRFSAKVAANDKLPVCGTNKLINTAKVTTGGGSISDTASVTVKRECAPVVKYTCDALAIKRLTQTSFRFTTTTTAQNATFKSVTYIIRDASGKEVERKTSTAKTLDYTRTAVGKYTIEAVVTFTVNGQTKTVSSADCKKEFEVPSKPDYCPIPGKEHLPKDSADCKENPPVTPPELPQTGAGENIVAIVGLGALIASIAYYVASRRALNQ